MTLQISSLQNPRVKNIVKLRQRRHRDSQRLTVVEGVREIKQALKSRIIPQEAYICPTLANSADAADAINTLQQLAQTELTQLFEVTPDLFAKIAYRGESGGLLLVIPYLPYTLDKLSLGNRPFLVVIEGVEKPGNLGAILRTADAAGVDGMIITGHQGADIHNPNVIRASLGAIFTVPVVAAANREVIEWLKYRKICIIAATPDAVTNYTTMDMTGPVALVMGSEAHGLSDEWLSTADMQVIIPMYGAVDSLNLAVSTALLLYEVVRQRRR